MVHDLPSTSGLGPLKSGATARTSPPANPGTATAGAAFQALLERLEEQARELRASTSAIEGPRDLAGAVDRAHASLQDALTLSDRLVEAYREVLAQPKVPLPRGGAK